MNRADRRAADRRNRSYLLMRAPGVVWHLIGPAREAATTEADCECLTYCTDRGCGIGCGYQTSVMLHEWACTWGGLPMEWTPADLN